ncbi:hypothetical protein [Pinirhizobacter sp.]|jgi:hypothetical protein|uniref:hypothetical protein n=1 Tax=Pinirhizobacter sp. TaxID=2950432 RepID=UPI002F42D57C
MSDIVDPRAMKILHNTFWSSAGWKRDSERVISADDLMYAKAKGVMFDPVYMDHDQAANTTCALVDRLDRRTVVDAFLSSLSTRRLDWRSVMGSYSVFQHFIPHEAQGSGKSCTLCGFYFNGHEHDFNVLNFERMKWGGVRHRDLVYAVMDLSLFAEGPAPTPTTEDIMIFQELIGRIRSSAAMTTASTLHSRFPESLKANKSERDIIVAILGFCDVLANSTHPGFSDVFIPADNRPEPHRRFVDMPYPACWWNGEMGVNEDRLKEYFAHVL